MKYEYADKYVSGKSDVPQIPHWAIFEFSSFTVPGDERSRTNPGHGYPEHTEKTVRYEVYLTEEKWKSQIEYRESQGRKDYTAAKINPVKIESKVVVSMSKTK